MRNDLKLSGQRRVLSNQFLLLLISLGLGSEEHWSSRRRQLRFQIGGMGEGKSLLRQPAWRRRVQGTSLVMVREFRLPHGASIHQPFVSQHEKLDQAARHDQAFRAGLRTAGEGKRRAAVGTRATADAS